MYKTRPPPPVTSARIVWYIVVSHIASEAPTMFSSLYLRRCLFLTFLPLNCSPSVFVYVHPPVFYCDVLFLVSVTCNSGVLSRQIDTIHTMKYKINLGGKIERSIRESELLCFFILNTFFITLVLFVSWRLPEFAINYTKGHDNESQHLKIVIVDLG